MIAPARRSRPGRSRRAGAAASGLALALLLAPAPARAESPADAGAADTADAAATPPVVSPQARTAEIAIRAAEEEIARSGARSPLLDRLVESARAAYAAGRYEDAIGTARRARMVAGRRGRDAPQATPVARMYTEVQYEALERLVALENRGSNEPTVLAARELVDAAEAAMASGNVTQAENLSRRAILMMGAMPPPRAARDTSDRRVDLNRATREELARVPGMTAEMIRNLLWFRRWIGPLRSYGELRYVPAFDPEYLAIAERWLVVHSPAR